MGNHYSHLKLSGHLIGVQAWIVRNNPRFPKKLRPLVDFIYGLLSGFPLCCVISFCRGRTGVDEELELRKISLRANFVLCQRCAKAYLGR